MSEQDAFRKYEHCGDRQRDEMHVSAGVMALTGWLGKEGPSKEMKSELLLSDSEPLWSRFGGRALQAGSTAG